MDAKEAQKSIGTVVVYYDALQKEYKEGRLLEYHADTQVCRIQTATKREIDISLNYVHTGTLDEVVADDLGFEPLDDIEAEEAQLRKLGEELGICDDGDCPLDDAVLEDD